VSPLSSAWYFAAMTSSRSMPTLMGTISGTRKLKLYSCAAPKGPPLVIAAFNTREEADAWMRDHPDPPHHANILISGEYFLTAYAADANHRALLHDPVLEFYLRDMIHEGLPAPVAVFNTLEEANTWLKSQPEPPRQVFIMIAGEYYLAVYHYKIKLRALYPISKAAKSVQRDKAAD
ncbi:hypothetical protein, partial [Hyalangium versicolor]|uniref:hypothetical protein n=1 Tax=Hyalangium versicolor TaxID=2861190 RepID=UPI001CCF029C